MWKGHIICALSPEEARVVSSNDCPPSPIKTTAWSYFPRVGKPFELEGASYFLLRVPGTAKGLFAALEEIMRVSGVHRDGLEGVENHRRLLLAINRVRCGRSDREEVYFTRSPERRRLLEMEVFEANEAGAWSGYLGCLDDPGCAAVLRRGC